MVSQPIRATITVGTCIILLLELVHRAMQVWPPIEILLYIVPFIPPYIITKTSMKINQRIAAHDFIRDATPYVFVAYPEDI